MEYVRKGPHLTYRQQQIYEYLTWAQARRQEPGVNDVARDTAQRKEVVLRTLLDLKRRGLFETDACTCRRGSGE